LITIDSAATAAKRATEPGTELPSASRKVHQQQGDLAPRRGQQREKIGDSEVDRAVREPDQREAHELTEVFGCAPDLLF
jgi:hypothetical protein